MKVVHYYEYGAPDVLKLEDAPKPAIEAGKVLIRVAACSVNPVDWKVRSGKAPIVQAWPSIPGGDIAGTVEAVGEGVSGFAAGDAVYAEVGLQGGYAEYVSIPAEWVAKAPAKLSPVEAASLPLVALTALQGFAADGRDLSGLKVLVHNAAGGVGTSAVQIAKALGATVVGTAGAKNAEFVKGLGADEVVDFRETPVSSHARDIDILMDLVGDDAALDLWALVKPKGSVIRIAGGADAPKEAEADGIRALKVRVVPDGAGLARIAEWADKGQLKPEVTTTFPIEKAGEAQELSKAGRTRGKIVLTI